MPPIPIEDVLRALTSASNQQQQSYEKSSSCVHRQDPLPESSGDSLNERDLSEFLSGAPSALPASSFANRPSRSSFSEERPNECQVGARLNHQHRNDAPLVRRRELVETLLPTLRELEKHRRPCRSEPAPRRLGAPACRRRPSRRLS